MTPKDKGSRSSEYERCLTNNTLSLFSYIYLS